MKKIQRVVIEEKRWIAKDTIEMVLLNQFIARNAIPGQFLHIAIPGNTLRRPISIADTNGSQGTVTILFKVIGKGTSRLSEFTVGTYLDVIGPQGNGFDLQVGENSTILLAGGGIGVPPIHFLAKNLADKNCRMVAVLGFQSRDYVFYEEKFQSICQTQIVTNDGSQGVGGYITDHLPPKQKINTFYGCGPVQMLKVLTVRLDGIKGYLSVEERMGCGVGACLACMIPANNGKGYKKICRDGPVFSTGEVSL
ncbi:dihydroorotate dehydrogenase electron transfer subunit [Virgibacillus halophilus]|uniref:dihydroorotate dehydrogenase electron transfer subunit n=1 Tax=Tigheibacillus halophilus TaxID=361280 RepID=UPI00362F1A1D